jgi:hypothetical protein
MSPLTLLLLRPPEDAVEGREFDRELGRELRALDNCERDALMLMLSARWCPVDAVDGRHDDDVGSIDNNANELKLFREAASDARGSSGAVLLGSGVLLRSANLPSFGASGLENIRGNIFLLFWLLRYRSVLRY